MNVSTRSFWLVLAVLLTALDEAAITFPASFDVHVADWLTFALAVLALVSAVLAGFAHGKPTPPPDPRV